MVGFVIAVMFGWLGGYRFYKKQYGLGFLYMFTLGLFFIGWAIDIFESFKEAFPKKAISFKRGKTVSFDCEVKGSFAESKKVPGLKRYDIVSSLRKGCELEIETAYYQGTPYFLVCAPNGPDIGALPKELSQYIKEQCPDAYLTAILKDNSDSSHPYIALKIQKGRRKLWQ